MIMMRVGALEDGRFSLFPFFTGYFLQEPYSRKYLRIFAICVVALVGFGIIFNVLYMAGVIEP